MEVLWSNDLVMNGEFFVVSISIREFSLVLDSIENTEKRKFAQLRSIESSSGPEYKFYYMELCDDSEFEEKITPAHEIETTDKPQKTENENVFYIDEKMIQFDAIKT